MSRSAVGGWRVALAAAACCWVLAGVPLAGAQDGPDPSGEWVGAQGRISLMLTGDALSFSYSAVFGQAVHICDGGGVAGLVAPGRWEYVDDTGTIAIIMKGGDVYMEPVDGDPSFCGAFWPGDMFPRHGRQPLDSCQVTAQRAYFHVVEQFPLERRKAYVIRGDRVEVVPVVHGEGENWVLARFRGPRSSTVGLISKKDLDCR